MVQLTAPVTTKPDGSPDLITANEAFRERLVAQRQFKDDDVRQVAIIRLTDQALLARIAKEDKKEEIRKAADSRLQKLKREEATKTPP
jgi:hypothetical protein